MDYRIKADLDFQTANNLRDVYSCAFPYQIGDLEQPQDLADYYAYTTKPFTIFTKDSTKDEYQFEQRDLRPHFIEAATIMADHQDAVLIKAQKISHDANAWFTQFAGRRSGVKTHGTVPHCDSMEYSGSITSLVANSDTTIIVPHDHTLAVLDASRFSHILDQPFRGNHIPTTDPEHWSQVMTSIFNWRIMNIDDEKRSAFEQVSRDLLSETVQYLPNTVFRMSSQSIHLQPPNLPKNRVCLIGITSYRHEPAHQ